MKRKKPFTHAEHAAYRDTLPGFREVLLGGSENTLPEPVDSRSSVEEDYQRLILDDLLYFFPGPYAMLSAYIDESGTHGQAPAMCVAGLLYTADAVKRLDQEWKEELERIGIGHFHTVDCAQGTGLFKGKDKDFRYQASQKFVDITCKHACGGAVSFLTLEKQFDEYRKSRSWKYHQYTTCAYACVKVLLNVAKKVGDRQLDLTIESGHKHMRELDALLRKLHEKGLTFTHGFRHKADVRPLQTADLWAYESWKRVSDQFKKEPQPSRKRKSLQALIKAIPDMDVIGLDNKSLPVLFEEVKDILSSEITPPGC